MRLHAQPLNKGRIAILGDSIAYAGRWANEVENALKADKKFADFINYDKVDTYKNFGGIRNEEDYLITETGARRLGKKIPLTPEEVEEIR